MRSPATQAHLEAQSQVKVTRGPLGSVYRCPHCPDCSVMLRRPISWGDTAKALATVANHIRKEHQT